MTTQTITVHNGNGESPAVLTREQYQDLKKSGMLWELHPDAPQEWPHATSQRSECVLKPSPAHGSHIRLAGASYQPDLWRVRKDTIYAAILAIEAAIEHTSELLNTHDASLGRTTLKNRTWAERLESDIRNMKSALVMLRAEPQSSE